MVDGQRYCNTRCAHDAGDRSVCREGCGCTAYARKRRLLREHRAAMRVMRDLIEEARMADVLEERLAEEDAPDLWLDYDTDMDEDSGAEDPEAQLRQELADRQQLVQAVQGALEAQTLRRELERARMQLEDKR
jgi:hypothetical protein